MNTTTQSIVRTVLRLRARRPGQMSNTKVAHDYVHRRPIFRTRRARHVDKNAPPSIADHERQALRTECVGCALLGGLFGAGIVAFFWVLVLWVNAGGA